MNKLYIFAILTLLPFLPVSAQTQKEAVKLLDRAADKFRASSGIKAGYTFSVNGEQGKGTMKLKGRKFVNNLGDHVIWFNGKTMWTLVRSNEEVNVTEPTADEVARMNPYSFVQLYKKGYTARFTKKSTQKVAEIELKATDAKAALKTIVMRINRTSLQPLSFQLTEAGGQQTGITITSYQEAQKFADATFQFNPRNYPNVEVVDLR